MFERERGGIIVPAFGGAWTLLKLEVLEKYLNFYANAMKNKKFKLCYKEYCIRR